MQLHWNTPRSRKRISHISFKFLLFPFVSFFVVFLLHDDVLLTCFLRIVLPANQVEGFFGKAFIDPYLAYKLGNVLVSMRTAQHFKSRCLICLSCLFLNKKGGGLPEFNQRTMNL